MSLPGGGSTRRADDRPDASSPCPLDRPRAPPSNGRPLVVTIPFRVASMKRLLFVALAACSGSLCLAAEPPRRCRAAAPEAQGVSSAAVLAFVEAADKDDRLAAQLHARAPRPRRRRGLVGAVRRRDAALAVLAEQELHLDGRRAGGRRGEAEPRRRGAEVLPRRRPGRAEQQPEGDARQRPAPHVHRAPDRAAAHGRTSRGRRPSSRSPSRSSRARTSSTTRRRPTCSRPSCRRRPARRCSTTSGRACSSRSASRSPTWETSPQGVTTGGYGLSVRTEDIAKFGQLYLQKGKWNGQAARARGVGRGGDRPADLQRQQPEERLGPGLRLPVLALPPRRLPRRRGVRPVLRRPARAGRGDRHHQRREGHAGGPEPGLGQAAAGHEAGAAARRTTTARQKLERTLEGPVAAPPGGRRLDRDGRRVAGKKYGSRPTTGSSKRSRSKRGDDGDA